MANKATGKAKKTGQRTMVKLIIPFRSSKTGAYRYKEQMVPEEDVQKLLK